MKTLKLLFILLAILPLSVTADEVLLGEYITYTGKVDANNQPAGKGKLEIVCRQRPDLRKDVLEGVFNNGVVTKAKLDLEKYNGPFWIEKSTFKGTVEYSISKDGKSITYKMTQGKFRDGWTSIAIEDDPFVLKRIPFQDSWEAEPFVGGSTIPMSNPDMANMLAPLNPSVFGKEESVLRRELFTLSKEWRLTSEKADIISYPSGLKVIKIGNQVTCRYPNGDTFKYISEDEGSYVTYYRKTFPDAEIICNNGDNMVEMVYSDKRIYRGTLEFGKEKTVSNIFQVVMQANDMASTGITFKTGTLEKDGQSIAYIDGKTEEEIAQEKKLREEMAAQAKIEEEKKHKEDEIALRKKYGVLNNEDGDAFVEILKKAQQGDDYEWAVAGLFLCWGSGVKQDAKLGVEYIKKAMNSGKPWAWAKLYGTMVMAEILWTGAPGLAKDQKRAYEFYNTAIPYFSNMIPGAAHHTIETAIYQILKGRCFYRCATVVENGQYGYLKNIDLAIEWYKKAIDELTIYDKESRDMLGFAEYRLGFYAETGRYTGLRNRPLARQYYRAAIRDGDAKTQALATQGLERIGY